MTKALQRTNGRIEMLQTYLELVDASLDVADISSVNNQFLKGISASLTRYKNYSRRKNAELVISNLYCQFHQYFREVIEEVDDRVPEAQCGTPEALVAWLYDRIDEEKKQVLRKGLMFLEMGRIYNHDGLADQKFVDEFGSMIPASSGKRINCNIGYARRAIKAIRELCEAIDRVFTLRDIDYPSE